MAESPRDRRGLGRGLAALLGTPEGEPPSQAAGATFVELPLDRVEPNPDQPRARIEPEALEALAASIRASGVLQPVVVAPPDGAGRHKLIAGERRWRAARMAGIPRIPAVVRRVEDHEHLELALAENLVRESLTPIETAQACACLIEDFGQSHAELAGRLGRSRPAISNLVRLLELPEAVQEMISRGELTEGHGRAILMADGPARRTRLAQEVVARGLSVRAAEALARQAAPVRGPRRRVASSPLGDAALEAFGTAFDAPVRVRPARGGGTLVELRFADEAALSAALDRLPAAGPQPADPPPTSTGA